ASAQSVSDDANWLAPPPKPRVGQQHWFATHLSLLQPTTATLQLTLFRKGDVSYAAEVYAGSVLFEAMYGGGGRAIWTAADDGDADALLISPGVGVHILPAHSSSHVFYSTYTFDPRVTRRDKTARAYGVFDVDISWLHEFAPHFAWEMGLKLG